MNIQLKNIVVFLLFILCASCTSIEQIEQRNSSLSNQTPQVTAVETESAPLYIDSVWPDSGTHISLSEYNDGWLFSIEQENGIPSTCAEFWIELLVEPGDFLSQEEIMSRFSLEIDDQLIERPDNVLFSDTAGSDGPENPETGLPEYRVPPGSPFFVCFTTPLEPGEHTATIIANKTSGEELRYTWSFVLSDNN